MAPTKKKSQIKTALEQLSDFRKRSAAGIFYRRAGVSNPPHSWQAAVASGGGNVFFYIPFCHISQAKISAKNSTTHINPKSDKTLHIRLLSCTIFLFCQKSGWCQTK